MGLDDTILYWLTKVSLRNFSALCTTLPPLLCLAVSEEFFGANRWRSLTGVAIGLNSGS